MYDRRHLCLCLVISSTLDTVTGALEALRDVEEEVEGGGGSAWSARQRGHMQKYRLDVGHEGAARAVRPCA